MIKTLESTKSLPMTTVSAKTSGASIDALTGLRMLAAGTVYLGHLHVWRAYPAGFPVWLQSIMKHGYIGVFLFFTLSGFVITYTYFDRLGKFFSPSWWSYFVARFARIYPMYFLVFVFGVATSGVSHQIRPPLHITLEWLTATQTWDRNIQTDTYYTTAFPLWSVGVEIFLYLCFPFVVYPILRRCKSLNSVVALLISAILVAFAIPTLFLVTGFLNLSTGQGWSDAGYYLYFFPPTHLCAFVSGAAAARLFVLLRSREVSKRENTFGGVAIIIAFAISIFLMLHSGNVSTLYSLNPALLPSIVVVIFCLARYRTPISWLLSRRWAVLLGEASYSFYLLHYYFLYINADFMGKQSSTISNYFYGALILGFIILTSLGSYTYFEMPMRRLIRRSAASLFHLNS